MDDIVAKLSEIEADAVKIMDQAGSEKEQISAKMNQRIQEFDEVVDADTKKQLSALNEKLLEQQKKEMAELKEGAAKLLELLDSEYQKNHTKMAQEILDRIIGA